jgi:RNA-binding protein 5/10
MMLEKLRLSDRFGKEKHYANPLIFKPLVAERIPEEHLFTLDPANHAQKYYFADPTAHLEVNVFNMISPADVRRVEEAAAAAAADAEASGKGKEKRGKKRKAADDLEPTPYAMNDHMQRWNQASTDIRAPKTVKEKSLTPEVQPAKQSYMDQEKLCCWLCRTKFKPEKRDLFDVHEAASKAHAANLQDPHKISQAMAQLRQRGLIDKPNINANIRDRAAERREAFKASKKSQEPSSPPQDASVGAPRNTNSASVQAMDRKSDSPPPTNLKALGMLKKMGYKEGEGLGASGSGRILPIEQTIYAAGVGLGAANSKIGDAHEEAQKNMEDGYKNFLDKTKDNAKRRFEGLG